MGSTQLAVGSGENAQGLTNGYRMPAEWEPHDATWLVWPQNRTDWPGKFAPIAWVYADIVRLLSVGEIVNIVVSDLSVEDRAQRCLRRTAVDLSRVRFYHWPTNRGWTRDAGPIFVRAESAGGRLVVTDWRFTAWAKYDDWSLDDCLPKLISESLGLYRCEPAVDGRRLVLEGGSIDVNGAGLAMSTEECLLSDVQARNPGIAREEMEFALDDYLGVRRVIWLGRGIAGDDTHGHIDDIARFVDLDTVVAAVEPDPLDANYEPLADNLDRLRGAVGDRLIGRVVELPMPSPVVFDGRRLPASYANFYIANGIVLVPTFNDPRDAQAIAVLDAVFPDHRVVGVHSRDLIWGLGAIHCMTQQQPL